MFKYIVLIKPYNGSANFVDHVQADSELHARSIVLHRYRDCGIINVRADLKPVVDNVIYVNFKTKKRVA